MSTFDEIIGATADKNELHPKKIEVGGLMVEFTDRSGKVWSVPADDSNVDMNETGLRSVFHIPDPDPDLYYQFVTGDRLNEYLTGGFALVTREEIGLPAAVFDPAAPNLGAQPNSHYQVGNLHCVKTPKVIEKRLRKAKDLRAADAIANIKVPEKVGKSPKSSGVEIHSRETKAVTGAPIVMPADKDFKEYPQPTVEE